MSNWAIFCQLSGNWAKISVNLGPLNPFIDVSELSTYYMISAI
jgi:hypothetical protein